MRWQNLRRRYLLPLVPATILGWGLWYWLPTSPRATLPAVPGKHSSSLYFSPDSRWLARYAYCYTKDPHTLRLWEVANGRQGAMLYSGSRQLQSLAFSPDGGQVAALWFDRDIQVWNTERGQLLATYERQERTDWHPHVQIVYSPTGRLLVYGPQVASGKLWDVISGREVASLFQEWDGNWMTTNMRGFLVGGDKDRVTAWNLATANLAGVFEVGGDLRRSALTPDARFLAGWGGRGFGTAVEFKVWKAGGGEENFSQLDDNFANTPALSPDGRAVAVISTQQPGQLPPPLSWLFPSKSKDPTNQVKILEIPGGRLLGTIDRARQVEFSPDGQTLAVEDDGVVRLYDYPLRRPWGTILFWAGLLAATSLLMRFANSRRRRFRSENTPPRCETAAVHPLPSSTLPASSADAASATHGVPGGA